jgi:hypothetical protein
MFFLGWDSISNEKTYLQKSWEGSGNLIGDNGFAGKKGEKTQHQT